MDTETEAPDGAVPRRSMEVEVEDVEDAEKKEERFMLDIHTTHIILCTILIPEQEHRSA